MTTHDEPRPVRPSLALARALEATPAPAPRARPTAVTYASVTENGAPAVADTGSAVVDLFFRTVRGADPAPLMEAAWAEDAEATLRVLLHCRDVRRGKGECEVSYKAARWLRAHRPRTYLRNLQALVEQCGSYKDLLHLAEPSPQSPELQLLAERLREDAARPAGEQVSLAVKWAPREHKRFDAHARALAAVLFPRDGRKMRRYRALLSTLAPRVGVVETLMSGGRHTEIAYGHVPAKAHRRYRAAFGRNDPDGYAAYLERVRAEAAKPPEARQEKINVAGTQPHELVAAYQPSGWGVPMACGADATVEAQWAALVDRVRRAGTLGANVAMVDVSGSMAGLPMQVAIALGLVTCAASPAPWSGRFLTFESTPQWVQVDTAASLNAQVTVAAKAPWGGSTNVEAGLLLVLHEARAWQVPSERMPRTLFVFSDMQFDTAQRGAAGATFFDNARAQFAAAGYALPRVVFWNLRDTAGGSPVQAHASGACMVSGYSAELLRTFMDGGGDFTPHAIMRRATARYHVVVDEAER